MISVASRGAADRIAARTLFKVLRAGSGTPARYSSMLSERPCLSPQNRACRISPFSWRAMPGETSTSSPCSRPSCGGFGGIEPRCCLGLSGRHPVLASRARVSQVFVIDGAGYQITVAPVASPPLQLPLALQLRLLLRCQHFVQLGHCGAVELLRLGLFLGHRLA